MVLATVFGLEMSFPLVINVNPELIHRVCCPLLVGIQTTFGGNTPLIMGRFTNPLSTLGVNWAEHREACFQSLCGSFERPTWPGRSCLSSEAKQV